MFTENLRGTLLRLRKPFLKDSSYWKVGNYLALNKQPFHQVNGQVLTEPTLEQTELFYDLEKNEESLIWSIERLNDEKYLGLISVDKKDDNIFQLEIYVDNLEVSAKTISFEAISLALDYLSHKKKVKTVVAICNSKYYVLRNVLIQCGFSLISEEGEVCNFKLSL